MLSVLVFVHEFGHFITAKRAGLRVDEFGFGFPPRVVGIQRVNGKWKLIWGSPKEFNPREGNTLYSINALPFGGFVRIKGESGEEQEAQDSFASRSAGRRIWIIAAGVLMNALLAVVLIAGGLSLGFPQVINEGVSRYAHVSDARVQVMGILPESPAARAHLVPGMRLISGNGIAFENAEAFKTFVTEFLGKSVTIVVEENSLRREVTVVPELLAETQKPGIGIGLADIATVRYPVWLAIPKAVVITGVFIQTIVMTVVDLIANAIAGQHVSADLTGPIGIAVLTGQAAREGFVYLLQFMAILSINLAILNIIPFPALDGGRILFIIIEKLRGRPVARSVEGWIHGIGFGILIILILFVTYRDIGQYGERITTFFKHLFGG